MTGHFIQSYAVYKILDQRPRLVFLFYSASSYCDQKWPILTVNGPVYQLDPEAQTLALTHQPVVFFFRELLI